METRLIAGHWLLPIIESRLSQVETARKLPVTNLKFTEDLGRRLHRSAVFRVPAALLRRICGDFANELLLGGQHVLPNKALSNGFVIRHETLRSAFVAIL